MVLFWTGKQIDTLYKLYLACCFGGETRCPIKASIKYSGQCLGTAYSQVHSRCPASSPFLLHHILIPRDTVYLDSAFVFC